MLICKVPRKCCLQSTPIYSVTQVYVSYIAIHVLYTRQLFSPQKKADPENGNYANV